MADLEDVPVADLPLYWQGRANALRILEERRVEPHEATMWQADAFEECANELRAALARASAQSSDYEFPYQRTFDAIIAATKIVSERTVSVSVERFQKAFNMHRDADNNPIRGLAQSKQEPVAWRQVGPPLRDEYFTTRRAIAEIWEAQGADVRPLYEAPPSPAPDGLRAGLDYRAIVLRYEEALAKIIARDQMFDGTDGSYGAIAREAIRNSALNTTKGQ